MYDDQEEWTYPNQVLADIKLKYANASYETYCVCSRTYIESSKPRKLAKIAQKWENRRNWFKEWSSSGLESPQHSLLPAGDEITEEMSVDCSSYTLQNTHVYFDDDGNPVLKYKTFISQHQNASESNCTDDDLASFQSEMAVDNEEGVVASVSSRFEDSDTPKRNTLFKEAVSIDEGLERKENLVEHESLSREIQHLINYYKNVVNDEGADTHFDLEDDQYFSSSEILRSSSDSEPSAAVGPISGQTVHSGKYCDSGDSVQNCVDSQSGEYLLVDGVVNENTQTLKNLLNTSSSVLSLNGDPNMEPDRADIIDSSTIISLEANDKQEKKLLECFCLLGLVYSQSSTASNLLRHTAPRYKRKKILRANRALRLQHSLVSPRPVYSSQALNCTTADVNAFQAIEKNQAAIKEGNECSSSEEENYETACDVSVEKLENKKCSPKKSKSGRRKRKKALMSVGGDESLQKYWHNRYNLFSKFDEGIKLDAESWYSVTPENVAKNISERCRSDLIVDAFCGAGGNAIQFAFTCERVIAIDIDPVKIELARNNAKVYGVEDRIEFIVADFFQIAPTLKADTIFLSPPWGGPEYLRASAFSLRDILPENGAVKELYRAASCVTPNVAIYLPRNADAREVLELAQLERGVEIEQCILDNRLVAIVAYFGTLRQYSADEDESEDEEQFSSYE